jgi:hypothetical protein
LEFLNEDTIKRATLSFMKTYYKFRPRNGETVITYDMMHPSGVLVDGHLSFPRDDGSTFVATFEATSANSAREVKFTLQKQQLLWDSLAISSVFTTAILFGLWYIKVWSLNTTGWLFSILGILGLGFLVVAFFHFFFKNNNRYRYIYAIEQFKQYHADEQWVAIGHDVFSDFNDAHYLELRNQCVSNGFGLVIVDKEEHVDLRITPAREEVFGKKRRTLKFMENQNTEGFRNFLPTNLERYRRPYLTQALTCAFSVLALSGLFYRQYQLRPFLTVGSELSYQDSMTRYSNTLEAESRGLVYNKEDAVVPDPNAKSYDEITPSVTEPVKALVNENAPKPEIGFYVYTPTDGYLMYDCARAGVRGTKYVVQDIVFRTFEEARKRIDQLKTYGLIANCISLACTENATSQGYCVYYELMYSEENAANTKANQIKMELETLHLPHNFIKIRILKF